ncbi:sensor histidine kinase [Elioraea sp.]|uniref:sensor histidine kinase n=1 Tax=Elioraea sp. TaxID=2185103 RepID=UPI0025C67155|nr:HAMP domain-containing sensor histidine kinase [Elioraea sp.]
MRSLALRLAVATALLLALGLGAAGWFVTVTVTQQIEAAFDARLASLLDAAVAGTARDEAGAPAMQRGPALPELEQPFSGIYWQITGTDGRIETSRSLWDQRLPAPMPEQGAAFRDAAGPRGQMLRLAARSVVPPGADAPLLVAAAIDRTATDAEIARVRRIVIALFVVLGAGLTAAVVGQLVAGLAPLRRARSALADVRAGRRDALGLDAPAEIAPLVAEIDALIVQNRATVAHARAHVGNLAHALKTPVAVLRNALAATPPDIAAARTETARLEHLVQHHLARARAVATGDTAALPPVAVAAVAEEIAGALRRLHAGRGITLTVAGDADIRVRVDRQDLAEMLGNLAENACEWAAGAVTLTAARAGAAVIVTVADDGPGLAPEDAATALARGGRLDEGAPGTGLGLAIVAELSALYRGGLALDRSASGGLAARLTLPAA